MKRGVICASAGNHAQGVALSAKKLGCRAVIVMPTSTPGIKIDAVRSRGGEVVLHGDSFDEAYAHAVELENREADLRASLRRSRSDRRAGHRGHGNPAPAFAPRADHRRVLRHRRWRAAAGVAAYIKRLRPEIKVIGVETFDGDAMKQSLAAGNRVRLEQVGLFSDGTAVKLSARKPSACARNTSTKSFWSTPTPSARDQGRFEDTRSILEPAGALAVAGAKNMPASTS
jgi:threonine dehydratase